MSLTIQQILLDSERLATRLKEDDSAADVLLSQTQTVYKQIDAMKQYAEETGELNELARQRPHSVLVAGIQQESRHLRELQQENRELRAALEEHQNALEVIMSKYRQQITHLVQVSKLNLTNLYNSQYTQMIRRQSEKMNEMAAVMKKAAEIDEKNATQDKEILSRLSTENEGLRELLDISVKFGSTNLKNEEPVQENETKANVDKDIDVKDKETENKANDDDDNEIDKKTDDEENQDEKNKNYSTTNTTAATTSVTSTTSSPSSGTTASSSSPGTTVSSSPTSSTSSYSSPSTITSTMKRNSNINAKFQS